MTTWRLSEPGELVLPPLQAPLALAELPSSNSSPEEEHSHIQSLNKHDRINDGYAISKRIGSVRVCSDLGDEAELVVLPGSPLPTAVHAGVVVRHGPLRVNPSVTSSCAHVPFRNDYPHA